MGGLLTNLLIPQQLPGPLQFLHGIGEQVFLFEGGQLHRDHLFLLTGRLDPLPAVFRSARLAQSFQLALQQATRDQLVTTGWLHNHARMWMAAWLVHWRRVHWKAGADWFLEHLLDGDPASNHLSWQWVASTFSHKPYFFNRGNLERYSDGNYCHSCPSANSCPFEGSYDQLENQLFSPMPAIRETGNNRNQQRNRQRRSSGGASAALARPKR